MTNDPNFNQQQTPTQPLPNTPPATAPNRTPFDTHLVDDDDNAPRYTQPLPSALPHIATPATPNHVVNNHVVINAVTNNAPRVPPQVVPDLDPATSNATSPNYFAPTPSQPLPHQTSSTQMPQMSPPVQQTPMISSPTAQLPASRVPLATWLGIAAVGGALAVVFGSSLFRRAAPPIPTQSTTTTTENWQRKPTTTAPTIAMKPSRDDSSSLTSNSIAPRRAANSSNAIAANSIEESETTISEVDNNGARDSSSRNSSSGGDTIRADNGNNDALNPDLLDEPARNLNQDRATSNSTITDDNADRVKADALSRNSLNNDERDAASGDSPNAASSSDSSRFVERRRAYSIAPPRDFRLAQKGRRTIWKGSQGAQLLVEVGQNDGQSPRAGWEALDRSLSKKYGKRYRSRGIRETTVAGRPAAIWEFDLRQKNGSTVRKIDVAVVDKNNGYAVLASAPVENFEQMRPTFERAISSFQIENASASAKPEDANSAESAAESSTDGF